MGSGYDVETERRHCPQHQHSRLTIGYRGIHPLCQPVKATALCLVLLHHASIIYLQLAKIAAGGQKLLYTIHSRILYQQQLQLASALRYWLVSWLQHAVSSRSLVSALLPSLSAPHPMI